MSFWFNINSLKNPYIHFFFSDLKTSEEREEFLRNYNNASLVSLLREMVQLFILFPFNDKNILEFGYSRFMSDDKRIIRRKLKEWQKSFYLHTLEEGQSNADEGNYLMLKKSNNSSFNYLMEIGKEPMSTLSYLEIALKAKTKKRSRAGKNNNQDNTIDLNLQRILALTFEKGKTKEAEEQ